MRTRKPEFMKNRKRSTFSISLSEFPESITEQEHAPHMSMKSIAKQLERGIGFRETNSAIYSTDLGLRNLQDVHDKHQQVVELFNQLPTEVKKLAQNDFRNFEAILADEKNYDVLKKYDLFVDKSKEDTKLYAMSEEQFQAVLQQKQANIDNPTKGVSKTSKNAE